MYALRSTGIQSSPKEMQLSKLAFLLEKSVHVLHYFYMSWTFKYLTNSNIPAFPSEKYLEFLLVRLYFYPSRTGGQSIISIPGH